MIKTNLTQNGVESMSKAYLYGQLLGTHSFKLRGGFIQPDEYAEIAAQYYLPGGETGTAATVLASLGVDVRIDGTHIGREVEPMFRSFYEDKSVDLSSLTFDPDYEGLQDYVIISGLVRSPMGTFQALYESGVKRWNVPREEDVIACEAAAVDPFFAEESLLAAELCRRHGKPYVTIDSRHDSPLHRHAAINVFSKEGAESYGGADKLDIMRQLMSTAEGLVIMTCGGGDMLYGRRGEAIKYMSPFRVEVRSTLGAGDTFKAGCVYGLLQGMPDDELVRFASACSAIAISRFPLPLDPPRLEEVEALIARG